MNDCGDTIISGSDDLRFVRRNNCLEIEPCLNSNWGVFRLSVLFEKYRKERQIIRLCRFEGEGKIFGLGFELLFRGLGFRCTGLALGGDSDSGLELDNNLRNEIC